MYPKLIQERNWKPNGYLGALTNRPKAHSKDFISSPDKGKGEIAEKFLRTKR